MKATLVLSLLLLAIYCCCCQLASAIDADNEQVETTTGVQPLANEPVEEEATTEPTRQIDFAEQEAKLMERYAHLMDDVQDDGKDTPPPKKGNWLTELFRFGSRRSLHDDYLKINEELKKRLPDDETPEKNFDMVLEWYMADGKANKQLGEALGQLASLVHLTNEQNRCNVKSEANLRLNNQAIAGASSSNRVANIVRFFIAYHQRECLPVYKQRFSQISAKMGDDTIDKVKATFSDNYVATMSLDHPELLTDLMLSESDIIGNAKVNTFDEARAKLAKDVLSHLTSIAVKKKKTNFIEDGHEVNKDKLNSVVEANIVKPCKKYVAKLGPEVFVPFSFDLSVGQPPKEDTPDVQFSFGLIRFELCELILRAQKSIKADLLELARESAKKEP